MLPETMETSSSWESKHPEVAVEMGAAPGPECPGWRRVSSGGSLWTQVGPWVL